jgi:hypothetical protein
VAVAARCLPGARDLISRDQAGIRGSRVELE